MSFKIYDTTQCTNVILFPNCEADLPPQVQHQVSGDDPLDFGLGIPYYANEVFKSLPNKPIYVSNNGQFSFVSTQNVTSEYAVAGWNPAGLQTSMERFLSLEGHDEILSYSPSYRFFSMGNTQSIGAIVYFAKKYAATLGKTLSVKCIGPSYFNVVDTTDIVGVPFNMYETVQDIQNLPKGENDFWLFYVCSPNNPDGRIYNTISDIPTNIDSIYFDGAYSYKHYVENQRCFPEIFSIISQRPNVKWFNYGFSLSKAGLASLRLSYNILCQTQEVLNIAPIQDYINGTTLGFGLGLVNSAQCFIDYINNNFVVYTESMKNLIDSNRQKIIDSTVAYFSSKYPENPITVSPTVNNVPYVWIKVEGVNVFEEFASQSIIVKNGISFFVSPMVGSNNYCRISAMPLTFIVDKFANRLA